MKNIDLDERRKEAAKASVGTANEAIYSSLLRVGGTLPFKGTVLDFGAGTGHLAGRLCKIEAVERVVAADLVEFPAAEKHPKLEWHLGDLNNPLEFEDGAFDVIVASEIIEHLENPRAMIRECFRLLKPDGKLLLSTPNNESWRAIISLIARGHFSHFTNASYPAHITALLRLDLERIMTEAGFAATSFFFTDHGCIPGVTSKTWQSVSFGFLRGLRHSDNVLCVAQKSKESPGGARHSSF